MPVVEIEDVHKEAAVVELVPPATADIVMVLATESNEEIVVPDAIVTVPTSTAICCPTATLRKDDTFDIVALDAVIFPVNEASALVKRVTSA